MFGVSTYTAMKIYAAPSNPHLIGKEINLGNCQAEFGEYLKGPPSLQLSSNGEWVLIFSADGRLSVRSLIEREAVATINAHSSQSGVKCVAHSSDMRFIYSLGRDGLVRKFDWKYTPNGRREMVKAQEIAVGLNREALKLAESHYMEFIGKNISDTKDSLSDEVFIESFLRSLTISTIQSDVSHVEEVTRVDQLDQAITFMDQVQEITQKLVAAIKKNDEAPESEKIAPEEFIIDYEKRDRLVLEADAELIKIREAASEANLKRRVIRERILNECWNSMEVNGLQVKSFRADPKTESIFCISNHPIRKRSQQETDLIQRIKVLRSVDIKIQNEFGQQADVQDGVSVWLILRLKRVSRNLHSQKKCILRVPRSSRYYLTPSKLQLMKKSGCRLFCWASVFMMLNYSLTSASMQCLDPNGMKLIESKKRMRESSKFSKFWE